MSQPTTTTRKRQADTARVSDAKRRAADPALCALGSFSFSQVYHFFSASTAAVPNYDCAPRWTAEPYLVDLLGLMRDFPAAEAKVQSFIAAYRATDAADNGDEQEFVDLYNSVFRFLRDDIAGLLAGHHHLEYAKEYMAMLAVRADDNEDEDDDEESVSGSGSDSDYDY